MPPNWCNAPYLVQTCPIQLAGKLSGATMEQRAPRMSLLPSSSALLSAALHYLAWHCTR